jgi:uncharacterized protein YbjT (DUF2867 family)
VYLVKVILFGGTGMIGQGVLRECLLDSRVESLVAIGRAPVTQQHAKLKSLVHADLYDYSAVAPQLSGLDACLFCLGTSSAGMSEEAYTKVTYDLTLAAAKALVAASPGISMLYISGAGAEGGAMWARVKKRTEDALLALPFKSAYMFRPGLIRPLHGITSRTASYRVAYAVLWPFMPLFTAAGWATSTESLGRAMINVADKGWEKKILETKDINAAAVARG